MAAMAMAMGMAGESPRGPESLLHCTMYACKAGSQCMSQYKPLYGETANGSLKQLYGRQGIGGGGLQHRRVQEGARAGEACYNVMYT